MSILWHKICRGPLATRDDWRRILAACGRQDSPPLALRRVLSARIFRGGCSLKVVIETGLKAIAKNTYPGLETVVFCGFTPPEQTELKDFAASVA